MLSSPQSSSSLDSMHLKNGGASSDSLASADDPGKMLSSCSPSILHSYPSHYYVAGYLPDSEHILIILVAISTFVVARIVLVSWLLTFVIPLRGILAPIGRCGCNQVVSRSTLTHTADSLCLCILICLFFPFSYHSSSTAPSSY